MADRNVTFLILAKDLASRTIKNIGDSTDRTAQKLRDLNVLGLGPLATTAAALGPALLPVMGAAVTGAVALGASFTAAGAATGVFGAVVATTFTEVAEASKKSADLRDKISLLNREISMAAPGQVDALVKSRNKAILEYKARLAELPVPTRNAVMALDSLKTSWEDFVEAQKPTVLPLMTRGMTALAGVIPRLQPLFDVAAAAAGRLMTAFEEFAGGERLDDTVAFLAARAGPAFQAFGTTIANLAVGVGNLAAPFLDMSGSIEGGMVRMSAAFRDWADTSGQAGVERMIEYVVANGPQMASTFGDMAGAFVAIGQAAAPLAPVTMAIAGSLARIIDAIPPDVLTVLVGGFIAWSVAVQGLTIITRIVGPVVTLAKFLVPLAKWTTIAAGAQWAWNAALVVGGAAMAILTSPITLIILGIAALAGAFYLAWTKSETFRNIVTGAFDAVVNAGKAVGEWFAHGWDVILQWYDNVIGFFQQLPGRIMGFLAALPGMYARLWLSMMNRAGYIIGFAIGAVIGFFQRLPGRIMGAILRLSGLLVSFWSNVWNRTKALVSAGASAVVSFFRALPGRAASAVSSLWTRMGSFFRAAASGAATLASQAVSRAVAWFRQLPGRAASALSSLPGRIRGVFSGAASWLVDAGRNVVMGLVNGIGNAVGAAVAAARNVAGSIVSGVKAGMGIGSPSRVMAEQVGRWIPPGITAGILDAMPSLLRTVAGQMDRVTGAAVASGTGTFDFGAGAQGTRPSVPFGAGGGGSVVVINVNGALDPVAVGRQVVSVLTRWAQSQGKTLQVIAR